MRTLISLGMAAFVLVFILSADLAAESKLEKRLMKEGWVKLTTKELKELKDFTASDGMGGAEYIDPSGTKVVTQSLSGNISKGKREITADGRYCHRYPGAKDNRCLSLWKRVRRYSQAPRASKPAPPPNSCSTRSAPAPWPSAATSMRDTWSACSRKTKS